MFIIYIKQTWQLIKENRVLSAISIIGTALAMAMIIALVFVYEVQMANTAPEVNRDRTLYIKSAHYKQHDDKGNFFSFLSLSLIKECFYPLTDVEAVSGFTGWADPVLVTTSDGRQMMKAPNMGTDAAFWKLFSFQFLAGEPFRPEEFESGLQRAVISERIARYCFGGAAEALGQTIKLNHREFTVCGVVESVSTLAVTAYSEVWVPYTSLGLEEANSESQRVVGEFYCLILAKSESDFKSIIAQVNQAMTRFNAGLVNGKADLLGQPNTHLEQLTKKYSNREADVKGTIFKYGIILFILLLVPAINLSGLTISRMRQRIAEIGIRKAFGATRYDIIKQVAYENLLLTLIGGAIGIVIGYLVFTFGARWFLGDKLAVLIGNIEALNVFDYDNISYIFRSIINPLTLLYIFLFCLLLNLMSAMIPAWLTSRKTIINALNEQK